MLLVLLPVQLPFDLQDVRWRGHQDARALNGPGEQAADRLPEPAVEHLHPGARFDPVVEQCGCRRAQAQGMLPADLINRDRKSTRLNSSHVASSYAVFCLHKTR